MIENNNAQDVVIRVENLHKKFGDHHVLRGINTTVRKGESLGNSD